MSDHAKTTIPFSRVGDIDLLLDLHIPETLASKHVPAVVWLHGGGMVAGNRDDVLAGMVDYIPAFTLAKGWLFISADYRLIGPSTGFDEIDDVRALFKFIASPSFAEHLPSGVTLDTTRIAVTGGSGGGYPARVAALYAQPRPKVLFSLFGMGGAFLTDHWVQPRDEPLPFPGSEKIDDAFVAKVDMSTPIADNPFVVQWDGTISDKEGRWGVWLHWCRKGELLDYVLGKQGISETLRKLPESERLAAVPKELLPALPETQMDATFPPTYLLHGDVDPIVLVGESQATYERLKELGVKVEMGVVKGGVHGLSALENPLALAEGAEAAQSRAMEWIAAELARD